jgi:hypothetical protein
VEILGCDRYQTVKSARRLPSANGGTVRLPPSPNGRVGPLSNGGNGPCARAVHESVGGQDAPVIRDSPTGDPGMRPLTNGMNRPNCRCLQTVQRLALPSANGRIGSVRPLSNGGDEEAARQQTVSTVVRPPSANGAIGLRAFTKQGGCPRAMWLALVVPLLRQVRWRRSGTIPCPSVPKSPRLTAPIQGPGTPFP